MSSKRQGQYAPKQNSIPQPIAIGASGSQQGKGNAVPKIGPSPATVKPVTASKVSEETIKRADEYVEGRLNEFTSAINNLKDAIEGIPATVPVAIPEDA